VPQRIDRDRLAGLAALRVMYLRMVKGLSKREAYDDVRRNYPEVKERLQVSERVLDEEKEN
jgi:hypothetical protein